MGAHPLNLLLRFFLELTAFGAVGIWGWKTGEGWMRYVLAFCTPLLLAVVWGTFAVPDDPSRSGAAPVVTPGLVRLFLELGIFTFACWALIQIGWIKWCWILAAILLFHYVISYDRIIWLLSR
jgi:hypothetical protein